MDVAVLGPPWGNRRCGCKWIFVPPAATRTSTTSGHTEHCRVLQCCAENRAGPGARLTDALGTEEVGSAGFGRASAVAVVVTGEAGAESAVQRRDFAGGPV